MYLVVIILCKSAHIYICCNVLANFTHSFPKGNASAISLTRCESSQLQMENDAENVTLQIDYSFLWLVDPHWDLKTFSLAFEMCWTNVSISAGDEHSLAQSKLLLQTEKQDCVTFIAVAQIRRKKQKRASLNYVHSFWAGFWFTVTNNLFLNFTWCHDQTVETRFSIKINRIGVLRFIPLKNVPP